MVLVTRLLVCHSACVRRHRKCCIVLYMTSRSVTFRRCCRSSNLGLVLHHITSCLLFIVIIFLIIHLFIAKRGLM